ncbi:MAG: hypothetical protein ABIO34_10300 [Arthrobacter oryzae]
MSPVTSTEVQRTAAHPGPFPGVGVGVGVGGGAGTGLMTGAVGAAAGVLPADSCPGSRPQPEPDTTSTDAAQPAAARALSFLDPNRMTVILGRMTRDFMG